MYLSQLKLDLRSRKVIWALADCQRLHQLIMTGFPKGNTLNRSEFNILFRLERDRRGWPAVLVQSAIKPEWSEIEDCLTEDTEPKELNGAYSNLREGMVLAFRLRANPTKRAGKSDETMAGKRVDIRDEESRLEWLQRKAEKSGFVLLNTQVNDAVPEARANPEPLVRGMKGKRPLTFGSALFEGLLRVTDADAFQRTLTGGVGSGKAYGFGLLSVAPPR